MAVNCGALMDTLLESELFGHERGAFTDAHARRPGLFGAGARGTLFLDEVDKLTPPAQAALLRVLQDRRYRVVGSTGAAGGRAVRGGDEARLEGASGAVPGGPVLPAAGVALDLPPLRDRPEDILPLARHFLAKYADDGRGAGAVTAEAEAALLAHEWPGTYASWRARSCGRCQWRRGDGSSRADLGLPERPSGASASTATEPG